MKEIVELKKKGFQRLKVDSKIYEIDEVPNLKKNYKHNIDVLVDRVLVNKNIKQRLSESIEIALSLSNGLIYVENLETKKIDIYSSKLLYSQLTKKGVLNIIYIYIIQK